ncbi:MAG: PLDc N-terminal domain-containing protein [Gammaproteobacteria bacterium]|nr:PLDc N-terminal domain-containing protein [Gammaproteobacteria bacterium]
MILSQLGALLILLADVYAVIMILQSSEQMLHKALWVLLVVLLPLIGLIVWYLMGPGRKPF